jgi:acid stress-induced BolA-like protein IbaG/YrbA
MKDIIRALFIIFLFFTSSCKMQNQAPSTKAMTNIESAVQQMVIDSLQKRYPDADEVRIETGVKQTANFWRTGDGSPEEFKNFCLSNFTANESALDSISERISRNLEILYGNFNQMSVLLKEPLHMPMGEVTDVDMMFGGYEPSSHLTDDFFKNKLAFYILLNFKYYSLNEKLNLQENWNRKQWVYARLGDLITSRVPSDLNLKYADIVTKADAYISDYNIYMETLRDGKQDSAMFPKGMKLISHWGLRDELKANYAGKDGLEKQKIIYEVMKRIINQEIPAQVINSDKYLWNPFENKITENGKEIKVNAEDNIRYQTLLTNFKALKEMDPYNPFFSTYIQAKFNSNMEIPQPEVEKLFKELVSSSEVKRVATLIETRLGRKLEPFDIWYDGFKSRSSINQDELTKKVKKDYATAADFEKKMPAMLQKLGFTAEKAKYIGSKIRVDAARGSGHAWGAAMKGDKARLRTRVSEGGMDYKGFNIAMHEFGHCVEQTLTLYDMDYYLLNGVPNTAFTEALAFVFQERDLQVLGFKNPDPLHKEMMALDIFWGCYEIMGVSLVDMNVWKWLYAHPDANKKELKEAVIRISKEVWNKYYADVFGVKDQSILAIYSHMIDNPLYLSAYPIGHLIQYQLEKQLEGKDFGKEVMRIYAAGRITPDAWMKNATGQSLSNKPLLEAVNVAVEKVGAKK